MYLCIYIATHLHTEYQDWLQAVLQSNARSDWRYQSSELRDALGGGDQASLEIHMEAMIVQTWKPWSSELRDALRGRARASWEMHLDAMIDWT